MTSHSLAAIVLLTSVATLGGAQPDRFRQVDGGIVRGATETRQLALVFTGHEFAEGATTILDELARRRLKASFFLTGTMLRDRGKAPIVERMVRDGHYVGPHSDGHLLYAPWTGPKVTLVSREAFTADLEKNLEALRPFGVSRAEARFFLPSYEWYTEEIVEWTRAAGLTLVCHTPGTRSNADYTEERTPQFVATDAIFDSILTREREDPHGLNGFMLLLHVGAGPRRADKFHRRVGELLDALAGRGYAFVRVDDLLR